MNRTLLVKALTGDDPADVEAWCTFAASEEATMLRAHFDGAIAGNSRSAREYIEIWRRLVDRVLRDMRAEFPDLVVEVGGVLLVTDVERVASPVSSMVLELEALVAPFSSWVTRSNDVGLGACAALIQSVRVAASGLHPVELDVEALPHVECSDAQVRAFRGLVLRALEPERQDLERIQEIFGLSTTKIADLFGVTRQALDQWRTVAIPASRQEKLATVGSIADLLDSNLKTGRIPGVVRRPAAGYGGRSMLDMITEDRQDEVLSRVRASFDWAVPA